jgi:hypothetical protein
MEINVERMSIVSCDTYCSLYLQKTEGLWQMCRTEVEGVKTEGVIAEKVSSLEGAIHREKLLVEPNKI